MPKQLKLSKDVRSKGLAIPDFESEVTLFNALFQDCTKHTSDAKHVKESRITPLCKSPVGFCNSHKTSDGGALHRPASVAARSVARLNMIDESVGGWGKLNELSNNV